MAALACGAVPVAAFAFVCLGQGLHSMAHWHVSLACLIAQDQFKLVTQGEQPQQDLTQRTRSYLAFADSLQAATSLWGSGLGAVLRQVHSVLYMLMPVYCMPLVSVLSSGATVYPINS